MKTRRFFRGTALLLAFGLALASPAGSLTVRAETDIATKLFGRTGRSQEETDPSQTEPEAPLSGKETEPAAEPEKNPEPGKVQPAGTHPVGELGVLQTEDGAYLLYDDYMDVYLPVKAPEGTTFDETSEPFYLHFYEYLEDGSADLDLYYGLYLASDGWAYPDFYDYVGEDAYYFESNPDTYSQVELTSLEPMDLGEGRTVYGTCLDYVFYETNPAREITLWTELPVTKDLVCVQILEVAYEGECTLDDFPFIAHAVFDGLGQEP